MNFIMPHFVVRCERWKYNKELEIWASNLGHFKDSKKRNLYVKIEKNGYCRVFCAKAQKYLLAHRVVLMTWRPIANYELMTVDHLNHNKRDNSVDNLEWVTKEENLNRAYADFIEERKMNTVNYVVVEESTGMIVRDAEDVNKYFNKAGNTNFNRVIKAATTGTTYCGYKFILVKMQNAMEQWCKDNNIPLIRTKTKED